MDVPPDRLEAFLEREGLGRGPLRLERIGDGHSNLTYLVECADRRLVLRRPPRPPYQPRAHDVAREGRIQQALLRAGVPVPRVLAVCDDAEPIGAPFYVAEFVDGVVLTGATPAPLARERDKREIARRLATVLAELHALDHAAAGLGALARPGYLDRQLRLFGRIVADQPRTIPALERLGDWLRRERPASGPPAVVHGDFRLGNVMLARTPPPQVLAVLDWELSTVGDPLVDVGWMAALWAEPGDPDGLVKLSPATTEPGYPSRSELIDLYCAAAGREPERLRWYMVLALWRLAAIMEANYARALAAGGDDEFAIAYGADIPTLADFAETLAHG